MVDLPLYEEAVEVGMDSVLFFVEVVCHCDSVDPIVEKRVGIEMGQVQ